jgi:hypothetical protein
MVATPAEMQQMATAQSIQQAAPAQSIQQVQPEIQSANPQSLPPVIPTPAPSTPTPQIGGEQSLTPGEIIFTEYQARVFNQTEAMYKTNGFLGISLFEDSYLLSKATANYIVSYIALAGTVDSINPSATQTYRGVLGIAAPAAPPPPIPTSPTNVRPAVGNPTAIQSAVTPTNFTSPTVTQPISIKPAKVSPSQVPSSLNAITKAGGKIICNELYRQGYLSEQMWDADERYGEMMFESDPKLVIGYQMWARHVVKYMKKNPNNTKMAYWLFKPWTEYMGYKMGVVEKPTLRGRFTNWIGTQFSYAVFNLYNGKRLLDKYNYKVFKSENNIGEYKIA